MLLIEVLGRVIEEVDKGLLYIVALVDLVLALPRLDVYNGNARSELSEVLKYNDIDQVELHANYLQLES